MRHAGISVTVTSITDVMAFGLGAFTVLSENYVIKNNVFYLPPQIMPGLQAFCVSAAICIALIFLLQVSEKPETVHTCLRCRGLLPG